MRTLSAFGVLHLLLFAFWVYLPFSFYFLPIRWTQSSASEHLWPLPFSPAFSSRLSRKTLSSTRQLFSLRELSGFLAPCLVFPFGSRPGLTQCVQPGSSSGRSVTLYFCIIQTSPFPRFLGHCCPSPAKSSFKISFIALSPVFLFSYIYIY